MFKVFKSILLFALLTCSFPLFAQPELSKTNLTINGQYYPKTISFVDHTKNSHIFFVGSYKIYHLKYNQDFELIHQEEHDLELHSASSILGYNLNDDNSITIYLKDYGFKNILVFSFSTDNSIVKNTIKFEKKYKDEIILNYLNHDNRFFILSNRKNSSELQLYKFSDASYDILSYDFSAEKFYSEIEKPTNIYNLLRKEEISIIENDIPSSIQKNSKKFKLYKLDNEFLITLNHRKNSTKIIRLDVANPMNSRVDLFFIPVAAFKNQVFSNSLIHKNRLFQFLASKNDFFMQVFEVNSKILLKEFKFNRYNDIPFNNSPLYIGNGSSSAGLNETRETGKFLKLISSNQLGVMTFEKNDNLILTIGGSYITYSGGGFVHQPGGSASYFEGGYRSANSVYTRCLFNLDNLEHQKGFAPINVFDLISIYKKQDIKDVKTSLETMYKYDDFYVLGYFDKQSQQYTMLKF